ncbi:MAG: drug efflux transport system permease protein [Desulfovibrionales bacterium]|nr:drug efflux transport system permease protein [Desulfovibrionales bacterium]
MKGGQRSDAGSAMRLRGLLRKEALQILRDPSAIVIALILPMALLLLFGYGVSLDAKDTPAALVVEVPSPTAMEFAGRFILSRYFTPVVTTSMEEAQDLMRHRRVEAIVRLREDFERKLKDNSTAPIQIIVNGVDANRARQVAGYAAGVWRTWLSLRGLEQGVSSHWPVTLEQRIWFNPEIRSQNYLVPGLLVVIMTLSGSLLTALVMAREWERGTMEALLVTPVRVREIIIGKLAPNYALGMAGLALAVGMAVFLFGVPLRGSLLALAGVSTLFLLTCLGMGLLISVLARNQFVAGQAAILATFLPAFFLSGFIFDLGSTPWLVQAVSKLIAAKYYASAVITLFLAGNVWSIIWPSSLALAVLAGFFLFVAVKKTKKRLE